MPLRFIESPRPRLALDVALVVADASKGAVVLCSLRPSLVSLVPTPHTTQGLPQSYWRVLARPTSNHVLSWPLSVAICCNPCRHRGRAKSRACSLTLLAFCFPNKVKGRSPHTQDSPAATAPAWPTTRAPESGGVERARAVARLAIAHQGTSKNQPSSSPQHSYSSVRPYTHPTTQTRSSKPRQP
jgi:hypothetical protein